MSSVLMNKNKGFTLIELMITVSIIGIIAAFAYSSYGRQTDKVRRASGPEHLLKAAALQERYFLQTNVYTDSVALLGGANASDNHFTMSVSLTCDGACYSLTATASTAQAKRDPNCSVMTLNQLGQKRSFDGGSASSTGCW